MSTLNGSEHGSEAEDANSFSAEATATAEHVLDDANPDEVEELNLTENGEELTSEIIPELHFLESKRCTNIVHCRDIMYTIINSCYKISRFIESYYR